MTYRQGLATPTQSTSRKGLGRVLIATTPTLAAAIFAVGLSTPAQAQTLGHAKKHGSHSKLLRVVFAKKRSPYGTILTGSGGRTLYIHTTDGPNHATCTGGCAAIWPPVTVPAQATIGRTVKGLGFYKLKDGKKLLTIDKHPLYYFAADGKASTQGEGIQGIWYVVNPQGKAVKAALGKVKKKSTASSSYGY
jgi:predicted lipoprotein with Yx(FWY)xxD motif